MKKRALAVATAAVQPAKHIPGRDQGENPASQAAMWAIAGNGAKDTADYDALLEHSMPQYAAMRAAVTAMAIRYAAPQTTIVDLGCALGGAMAPLVEQLAERNTFLGCDTSAPMLALAQDRFADAIESGTVSIQSLDLRQAYPQVTASVTLAVLTLQFIPLEYRQKLLQRAWHNTRPGGALIIVEKLLGSTADIDDHLVDATAAIKSATIPAREQSGPNQQALESGLVPLTAHMNEELLRAAGFTQIECFWRYLNFGAWIAVREPVQSVAPMTGHALRGATIVAENTPAGILGATRELLSTMVERNALDRADIVSALFTVTGDLNAAFPAKAARQLGWNHVALLCAQEIPIPGAMASCLRVLLHFNTTRSRSTYHSVYLHGAQRLLEDDCELAGA